MRPGPEPQCFCKPCVARREANRRHHETHKAEIKPKNAAVKRRLKAKRKAKLATVRKVSDAELDRRALAMGMEGR